MNAEIKAKWLEALRSGKYQQGTQFLRNKGKYCCLGVLCDVVNPKAWVEEPLNAEFYSYKKCSSMLAIGVQVQVGLGPLDTAYLMRLNDTDRKTFTEIADY